MEATEPTYTELREELKKLLGINPGDEEPALFSKENIESISKLCTLEGLKQANTAILQSATQVKTQVQALLCSSPVDNNPSHEEFINWCKNVKHQYSNILYPVPLNYGKKHLTNSDFRHQVAQIQNFVKKAKAEGKKVRGAGARHSWSRCFPEDDQFLVSLYPAEIASEKCTTGDLVNYAKSLAGTPRENNRHSLCSIIKEPFTYEGKTLARIGAGVSNEQMRAWCIANGLQYKASILIVEPSFVGCMSTNSHGSGITTQPVPDIVYGVEFINCEGEVQVIDKDDYHHNAKSLVQAAASSLGLIGIITFITVELEPLKFAHLIPSIKSPELLIPKPDVTTGPLFERFKKAVHDSYSNWLYFPVEGKNVYENNFEAVSEIPPGQKLQAEYPSKTLKCLVELSMKYVEILRNYCPQLGVFIFSNPTLMFSGKELYTYYPSAIHYFWGIHNIRVRNFETCFNVPSIDGLPDYQLLQKIWWAAMDVVNRNKKVVNMVLEMRLFKGSECPLTLQYKFDYVCTMEIARVTTDDVEPEWNAVIEEIFSEFGKLTSAKDNKPVTIRAHWGKEWRDSPAVNKHMLEDKGLHHNFGIFKKAYAELAKLGNWNPEDGLRLFEAKVYKEFLDKAK